MADVFDSHSRHKEVKGTPETLRFRPFMDKKGIIDFSVGRRFLVKYNGDPDPQYHTNIR